MEHISAPKKILAPPPPQNPQLAPDTLPAPWPLSLLETPLLGFSIKNRPPPPLLAPRTPPSPSPSRNAKKYPKRQPRIPPVRVTGLNFRKIPVSVKFVSAILGPEMGASILWTPGKTMSTKFLVLGGGGILGLFFGGGEGRFYYTPIRAGEKPINDKTHEQKFPGIVRDYLGTVPRLSRHFPEISWEICLCVSLFPQEKATHPTHFRDNPEKLCMYSMFILGAEKAHKNKSHKISENPWTAGCPSNTWPVAW